MRGEGGGHEGVRWADQTASVTANLYKQSW